MKKTAVILALALGLSIGNLNATNDLLTSKVDEIVLNNVEVSPLCKAIAFGDLEEVNRLIKAGVKVNEKSEGMAPIHYAAKYNRVKIIRALLTAGAEVHELCDKGYTPLTHAKQSKATDAENFLKRFKKKTV
ncbi:ankyrin repeat domain-containing protein [Winogradskyella ursingii]|uniref:ankyrin repeat domain-containing protein n=1 Tax=Winogradskyella ursingii TaxID=2686079 RepID=UPI0015CE4016|nr:ankyrin repeat domain-containing protein [Winogradskyella ursingii]